MVTPRILTTRRLGYAPAPAHPARRRRSSARPLVEVAGRMAADRLRLSAFARIYAGSGVALVLALAYLAVGAQATQNAYSVSQLKDRNAQLVAEQDQLRYESASLHGPGRVEQEAQSAGLQRSTAVTYIDTSPRPGPVDLSGPIGPAQSDSKPTWERLFEALFGGHEALAAGPP